jgi:phosphotransferase system enzyme I (PtsI)
MISKILFGKTCSPGISIGPAVLLTQRIIKINKTKSLDSSKEIESLERALVDTASELQLLISSQDTANKSVSAEILQAHMMMLDDPEWKQQTVNLIHEGNTAAFSLQESSQIFKSMLESLDDEYLKARATDIMDLTQQVLSKLTGQNSEKLQLQKPSVLVAQELLPSEFLSLDKSQLLGLVFENSSNTSHSSEY